MQITPAILPHSFNEITEKLSRVSGICSRVQIDLCDGVFGLEKTWLPNGSEHLPEGFEYEFDLMLNNWIEYVPLCIKLGAKRIVMHTDFFNEMDCNNLLSILKGTDTELGIAVSNNFPIEKHIDLIKLFREKYHNVFVQLMGIRQVGKQGEPFDDAVIGRIIKIKQTLPSIFIQIDGSVNNTTAKIVKEAGADIIVSGSYIFNQKNPKVAIDFLKNI